MKVIKRDGREVEFDHERIYKAVERANEECINETMSNTVLCIITDRVAELVGELNYTPSVEDIQEIVEDVLMELNWRETAKLYIRYRDEHKRNREDETYQRIKSLVKNQNQDVKDENSNKNPTLIPTQRDYIAGEISKKITLSEMLPKEIVEAHNQGIIHFHDADYFIQSSHNCDLVNLEDMLQNGTVISDVLIEKPKTFSTACNITTQIIAQVASSQYGGQSISLAHLAPFVEDTRKRFKEKYEFPLRFMSDEEKHYFIEKLVYEDIQKGVQTIQYQVVTLMTTNGQAPFITVYMDINEVEAGTRTQQDLANIIEEVLRQRIQGVKNEKGVWVAPAFPKLIYALDECNINPDSKYYYLTKLAAECTAKRMVPDYISNKIERELKGDTYTCMGCRSFLTPDRTTENYAHANNWVKGKKYYGRFNQGVVTINLPDVAYSSGGDRQKFWDILNSRLDNLCYPALMARHNRLKGTPSDVAPILWQHGALARLGKGETIDELLYHGYSTISLGYAGLYECVKYMTGESHTSGAGEDFALKVMRVLNEHCAQWKAETDIDFSLYGTPLESTTYKFAKCLQKRFGMPDTNYITNSYHVHVKEEIDAFKKLEFESKFQALSPGGAISYIEVPNLQNNLSAVMDVITYIYDHIMYAELNTKLDYCQECGFNGEIKIVNDDKKLVWECPNCGNRNQDTMNIVRRTCGYLGTNYWNQGRTQEIRDRVLHL